MGLNYKISSYSKIAKLIFLFFENMPSRTNIFFPNGFLNDGF